MRGSVEQAPEQRKRQQNLQRGRNQDSQRIRSLFKRLEFITSELSHDDPSAAGTLNPTCASPSCQKTRMLLSEAQVLTLRPRASKFRYTLGLASVSLRRALYHYRVCYFGARFSRTGDQLAHLVNRLLCFNSMLNVNLRGNFRLSVY